MPRADADVGDDALLRHEASQVALHHGALHRAVPLETCQLELARRAVVVLADRAVIVAQSAHITLWPWVDSAVPNAVRIISLASPAG